MKAHNNTVDAERVNTPKLPHMHIHAYRHGHIHKSKQKHSADLHHGPDKHGPLQLLSVNPDELPNRPAPHSAHTPPLPLTKVPKGHRVPLATTPPAPHTAPDTGTHTPLQLALVNAVSPPYVPAGHGEHEAAPPPLQLPVPHSPQSDSASAAHAEEYRPAGQSAHGALPVPTTLREG